MNEKVIVTNDFSLIGRDYNGDGKADGIPVLQERGNIPLVLKEKEEVVAGDDITFFRIPLLGKSFNILLELNKSIEFRLRVYTRTISNKIIDSTYINVTETEDGFITNTKNTVTPFIDIRFYNQDEEDDVIIESLEIMHFL